MKCKTCNFEIKNGHVLPIMKKTINGVRYDTEKSVFIGLRNEGQKCESEEDSRSWIASLYRTPRSGRYFLAGEGGPMSRFAQSAGQNSWTFGGDIIPLSLWDAVEWADLYLALTPREIKEHFGITFDEASNTHIQSTRLIR